MGKLLQAGSLRFVIFTLTGLLGIRTHAPLPPTFPLSLTPSLALGWRWSDKSKVHSYGLLKEFLPVGSLDRRLRLGERRVLDQHITLRWSAQPHYTVQ